MTPFKIKNRAEQVADYLRGQIASGRWGCTIPGVHKLASEVGVNFKTVNAAMEILEAQGALSKQGAGRRRVIKDNVLECPSLRVGILPYEMEDLMVPQHGELRHLLQVAGHHVKLPGKSLQDVSMDPRRVARLVKRQDADVWVVWSGAPEVLSWFAHEQDKPVFALYGRYANLTIPSVAPRKNPAIKVAIDRLVELGHRRIVMLCRDDRRKPKPGMVEVTFLDELESHGIETSRYNLPDWKGTPRGFIECIESLFRVTPPTALFIDEPQLMVAAIQCLGRMGLKAPENVSLICHDPHPLFSWCDPVISHINWEVSEVTRRVVAWVENIAKGKDDTVRTYVQATFVEGGTIGPAPR